MSKNWILIRHCLANALPYRLISALIMSYAGLMLSGCQSLPLTEEVLTIEEIMAQQQGLSPKASPAHPILSSKDAVLWRPNEALLANDDNTAEHSGGDLWHRIRGGYRLQAKQPRVTETVTSVMQKYLKYPRYFDRLTENASPWLYHIVSEIEERGMPLEIALLPAVESNFEPLARSPRSAAGLWQFMPETGKYFGLEQNTWYDGRQDIVASTDAALEYLQKLHRMFDGDWFNALAAYNWGEGNVLKAIKKNAALGKPTDYWSLDLPRETREFVPRLLAISTIIKDPKAYGVELEPIADAPYFEPVPLEQQIDLEAAADLLGLSPDYLKRLNPGYRGKATPPDTDGNHVLALPIDKADLFRRRVATLGPKSLAPTSIVEPPPIRLSADKPTTASHTHDYQIRRGDTLASIAHAHGTNIGELKRLNRGLNPRRLNVGQRLRVPNAQQVRSSSAAASGNKTDKADKKVVHTVRSGDSLWEIARRYQVSVANLRRWNKLHRNHTLQLGEKLLIWN